MRSEKPTGKERFCLQQPKESCSASQKQGRGGLNEAYVNIFFLGLDKTTLT